MLVGEPGSGVSAREQGGLEQDLLLRGLEGGVGEARPVGIIDKGTYHGQQGDQHDAAPSPLRTSVHGG